MDHAIPGFASGYADTLYSPDYGGVYLEGRPGVSNAQAEQTRRLDEWERQVSGAGPGPGYALVPPQLVQQRAEGFGARPHYQSDGYDTMDVALLVLLFVIAIMVAMSLKIQLAVLACRCNACGAGRPAMGVTT
jgi:hypothetical protein